MRIVPEANRSVNVGGRFGEIEVIGVPFYAPRSDQSKRSAQWAVCRCDCGNTFVVRLETRAEYTTCGCRRVRELVARKKTHGDYTTRLYRIWTNIKQRCGNPTHQNYKYYGATGRGICPAWKADFAVFRDWSFANGYADDLTIDRIDNSKGYEPSNCRWVTLAENLMNRESVKRLRKVPA